MYFSVSVLRTNRLISSFALIFSPGPRSALLTPDSRLSRRRFSVSVLRTNRLISSFARIFPPGPRSAQEEEEEEKEKEGEEEE